MAGSHWPLPVHKVNVKWIQCESRWMLGNRLANTWYHRPLPSIRGHRNTATHNNTTPGNQVSEACRPTSTWAAALRGRLPSGVHVRRGNSTFCTCRPYGDYMEPETPDCSASPGHQGSRYNYVLLPIIYVPCSRIYCVTVHIAFLLGPSSMISHFSFNQDLLGWWPEKLHSWQSTMNVNCQNQIQRKIEEDWFPG